MGAAGAPPSARPLPLPRVWPSPSPSLTADASDSPCACRPWTIPRAAQPLALPAPSSAYLRGRVTGAHCPAPRCPGLGRAEAGAATQPGPPTWQGPSRPGTAAAPGACRRPCLAWQPQVWPELGGSLAGRPSAEVPAGCPEALCDSHRSGVRSLPLPAVSLGARGAGTQRRPWLPVSLGACLRGDSSPTPPHPAPAALLTLRPRGQCSGRHRLEAAP